MVKVHADDLLHLLLVGKVDIMEDAAAQEGVGQLLFRVRGDDDDGAVLGAHGLLRLGDIELHLIELPEKVVREFKVRLVDLVDEQHDLLIGGKGLAELAELDIFCNIIHAGRAELTVVQALHHVVDIQAVLRFSRGLDTPDDELFAHRLRHGLREHRLAGAGLPLDEQRLFERHGNIHRVHQLRARDVIFTAFESVFHGLAP